MYTLPGRGRACKIAGDVGLVCLGLGNVAAQQLGRQQLLAALCLGGAPLPMHRQHMACQPPVLRAGTADPPQQRTNIRLCRRDCTCVPNVPYKKVCVFMTTMQPMQDNDTSASSIDGVEVAMWVV